MALLNQRIQRSWLTLSFYEVVPISQNQDTIGPLTRSMTDAAIVLSIIAGPDAADNFTLAQPSPVPDYTKALNLNAFSGKRIGVPRVGFTDARSSIDAVVNASFNAALDIMRQLGATIVDPANLPSASEIAASSNETFVLDVDFKVSYDFQATQL